MRRIISIAVATAAAVAVAATTTPPAAGAVDTIVRFDPARGELPEGIAFDGRGAMYVSLAPLGAVRRLAPDGAWTTHATIDPGTGGLGVLGLATDAAGTVYAAAPTTAPAWHGVVAIAPDGTARRLTGTEDIVFPNGLAWGRHGERYVTDSIGGAIWRIRPGEPAERWLVHESLAGTGLVNLFPIGANGIARHRGRLYVANSERRQVVEVPIDPDGTAGEPRVLHVFASERDLLDGIAADASGALYVAMVAQSRIARLDRSGAVTLLAGPQDGVNVPASLAFGTRGPGRRRLHVTNFALPAFTDEPRPGVVALDAGVAGARAVGPRG